MKKLVIATAIAMSITSYVMAADVEAVADGVKVSVNAAGEVDRIEITGTADGGVDEKEIAKVNVQTTFAELLHGSDTKSSTNTNTTVEKLSQIASRKLKNQKATGTQTEINTRSVDDFLADKVTPATDSNANSNDATEKQIESNITKTLTSISKSSNTAGKVSGLVFTNGYHTANGKYVAVYVWELNVAKGLKGVRNIVVSN